jgi:hypothetical protein
MHLKLYSILTLVYSLSVFSQGFDEDKCFKGSFTLNLQRSVGPFGLGKREISFFKNKCEISLEYQSFQYQKVKWLIDVCREPIHIKKGIASIDVIKKDTTCPSTESSYCQEVDKLLRIIQDEGLIFAEGQREDLSSSHGKAYCSFLLAQKYLLGKKAFRLSAVMKGHLIGDPLQSASGKRKEKSSVTKGQGTDSSELVDYSVKSKNLSDF